MEVFNVNILENNLKIVLSQVLISHIALFVSSFISKTNKQVFVSCIQKIAQKHVNTVHLLITVVDFHASARMDYFLTK